MDLTQVVKVHGSAKIGSSISDVLGGTVLNLGEWDLADFDAMAIVSDTTLPTATTDANGVAKINIEETELPVEVRIPAILPAGYSNAGSGKVSFADGAKTAEASLIKLVAHTVFVVDESENALAGANVQVCVDGVCQVAVDTDAEGKAVFYVNPDSTEAYAQFNTAPEGYNAPADAKIYYVDGATEATFVLTAK